MAKVLSEISKRLEDVEGRVNKTENDINTIELGVYGDAKNEIKGLIQSQRKNTEDITELYKLIKEISNARKSDRIKIVYFGMGVGAIGSAIVWIIELLFKR
jgi:archaellum component FlaC